MMVSFSYDYWPDGVGALMFSVIPRQGLSFLRQPFLIDSAPHVGKLAVDVITLPA